MRLKTIALPLGLFVTGLLWPAFAAAGDGVRFSDLDINQDGQLSAAEADAHPSVKEKFVNFDANADGQVSQEEWKAALQAKEKGY